MDIDTQKRIEARKEEIENFKKSLSGVDADLLVETDMLVIVGVSLQDMQEQINLYNKFKKGEIGKAYLKPEVLKAAESNNSLYAIKPEKIEELRNTMS